MIVGNQIHTSFAKFYQEENIDLLGECLNEVTINEFITNCAHELESNFPFKKKVPEPIQWIEYLVLSIVENQNYSQITEFWPTIIPASKRTREIVVVLVSIAIRMTNVSNLLLWISQHLFPPIYNVSNSSFVCRTVKAYCRCTVDDDKTEYWAILYQNKNLYLQGEQSINKYKPYIITTRVSTNTIVLYSKDKKVLISLHPKEPQQLTFWNNLADGNTPCFPLYITSPRVDYPEPIKIETYKSLVADDGIVILSIFNDSNNISNDTISYLITIFSYESKIHQLFSFVIISDIENKRAEIDKSLLTKFINYFLVTEAPSFLDRIIDYINNKSEEELSEVTFFTVLKYFLKCKLGFSDKIRHLISIAIAFNYIVNNNKIYVYNVIVTSFLNFSLFPYILSKSSTASVNKAVVLLKSYFALEPMGDWNNRIEKHFSQFRFQFIFGFAEQIQAETAPVEKNILLNAIGEIMYVIASYEDFEELHHQLLACRSPRGTVLSYSFAAAIARCFQHCYDPGLNFTLNQNLITLQKDDTKKITLKPPPNDINETLWSLIEDKTTRPVVRFNPRNGSVIKPIDISPSFPKIDTSKLSENQGQMLLRIKALSFSRIEETNDETKEEPQNSKSDKPIQQYQQAPPIQSKKNENQSPINLKETRQNKNENLTRSCPQFDNQSNTNRRVPTCVKHVELSPEQLASLQEKRLRLIQQNASRLKYQEPIQLNATLPAPPPLSIEIIDYESSEGEEVHESKSNKPKKHKKKFN